MYSAAVRGRRPPPPLGRLSAARDPCGGLGQRRRPAVSWARPGTGDLLCDLSLGFVASRKWVGTAVRVVTVTGVRLRRKPPAPQGSGERRGGTGPENSGRTQVQAAASGPTGAVSPRGRPAWDCPRVPEGRCRSALSSLLPGGSGGGRDPRVPFPVRPGPQSPGPPAVPDAAGPPGSS